MSDASSGDGPSTRSETINAGAYESHLARSRRMWNRWSDWYGLSESDFEPMREEAISRLGLDSGARVLDIGCGPGMNFASIRNEIGADGELVAVDYSPEMVSKARDRVAEHGWDNIEVVCADAGTVTFDEPFDAAIATLSMSVMPDIELAAQNVYRSLTPESRFVVFDVRAGLGGVLGVLNPAVALFLRWYANWNLDDDVVESLTAVFESVEVVETYMAGFAYTVMAEKQPTATDESVAGCNS